MKKLTLIFGIFFSILTFIGAAYVLYNEGGVSAGYAVVPMMYRALPAEEGAVTKNSQIL